VYTLWWLIDWFVLVVSVAEVQFLNYEFGNSTRFMADSENMLTNLPVTYRRLLMEWYSTFFLFAYHPDVISLQLCTPKAVGV
jgi:hypothetical protein